MKQWILYIFFSMGLILTSVPDAHASRRYGLPISIEPIPECDAVLNTRRTRCAISKTNLLSKEYPLRRYYHVTYESGIRNGPRNYRAPASIRRCKNYSYQRTSVRSPANNFTCMD